MESIDYLKVVRRRWMLLVAATLVGAVLGLLTAPGHQRPALIQITAPKAYSATAYVSLGDLTQGASQASQGQLNSISFLATFGEVPKRVAAAMNYTGPPAELANSVTIKPDTSLPLVSITTTSTDGAFAAKLVNTYAQQIISYLDGRLATQFQAQVSGAQNQLTDIQNQITALQSKTGVAGVTGAIATEQQTALLHHYSDIFSGLQTLQSNGAQTSGLILLEPAVAIPVQPAKNKSPVKVPAGRKARTAIGGLLGLVAGAAIALGLERLDFRVRSKDAAEATMRFPVIAEIPTFPKDVDQAHPIVVTAEPTSIQAEAFRSLRTSVALLVSPPPLRRTSSSSSTSHSSSGHSSSSASAIRRPEDAARQVVVVTSPGPGDGKSTTVANLAASFAQSGKSVLILSCDFLAPQIGAYLGVEPGPGVADLLADGPDRPELADLVHPCDVPGVQVVTAGDSGATPLDLLTKAGPVVAAARALADVVLIDTAPVLVSSEATELIPWVDFVLVVVRAGKTTTGAASQAAEMLSRLHAPVLGIVLNEAPRRSSRSSGAYYYYRQPEPPPVTVAVPVPVPVNGNARKPLVGEPDSMADPASFRRSLEEVLAAPSSDLESSVPAPPRPSARPPSTTTFHPPTPARTDKADRPSAGTPAPDPGSGPEARGPGDSPSGGRPT